MLHLFVQKYSKNRNIVALFHMLKTVMLFNTVFLQKLSFLGFVDEYKVQKNSIYLKKKPF